MDDMGGEPDDVAMPDALDDTGGSGVVPGSGLTFVENGSQYPEPTTMPSTPYPSISRGEPVPMTGAQMTGSTMYSAGSSQVAITPPDTISNFHHETGEFDLSGNHRPQHPDLPPPYTPSYSPNLQNGAGNSLDVHYYPDLLPDQSTPDAAMSQDDSATPLSMIIPRPDWASITGSTFPPSMLKSYTSLFTNGSAHSNPTSHLESASTSSAGAAFPSRLLTPRLEAITGGRDYTSLYDYFKLGPKSNDQSGDGQTNRRPLNSIIQSYASTSQTSNSLPGHHELPERDKTRAELEASNREFFDRLERERNPFGLATTPPTPPDDQSNTPDSESQSTRGGKRGRGKSRGGGRGRGGWKWAVRGTEHDKRARDKSEPRSDNRRRGPPRKRGRPRGGGGVLSSGSKRVDPGLEFTKWQGQAMEAYLNQNYEEAIECAKLAVGANPEMFPAYNIHCLAADALGWKREAVEAMVGALMTKRDANLYVEFGDRIMALEGDEKRPNDLERAFEAYTEATKIDTNNVAARARKMEIHAELGEYDRARTLCRNILAKSPDDLEFVIRFAELCDFTTYRHEWQESENFFQTAFRMIMQREPSPNPDEYWQPLNAYAEVIGRLNHSMEGVIILRRLARWLLGRKNDAFWDRYPDDREFDTTHDRRAFVPEFQQGLVSRDNARYGEGLPIELRVKLGLFRLKMGAQYNPEAFRHFDHLLQLVDDVENYFDLFLDVGRCLRMFGKHEEALSFFEPLKSLPDFSDAEFWIAIAQCYKGVGRNEEAEECYKAAIATGDRLTDAWRELAMLYEKTTETEKARDAARQWEACRRQEMLREQQRALERAAVLNKPSATPATLRTLLPRPAPDTHTLTPVPILPAPPRPEGMFLAPRTPVPIAPRVLEPGSEDIAVASDSDDDYVEGQDGNGDDEAHHMTPSGGAKRKEPKQKGMTNQQGMTTALALHQQRSTVHTHYSAALNLWPAVEAGDDEEAASQWMLHASAISDEFRSLKTFYPTGAQRRKFPEFKALRIGPDVFTSQAVSDMEALKKRLEQDEDVQQGADGPRTVDKDIATDFHGILISDLHRMMSELALLHAKFIEQDKCYDMLRRGLLQANVFLADRRLYQTSLAVCMCCALMFNDGELMAETARKYIADGDKRSGMAVQLLAAIGRLGPKTVYFSDSTIQTLIPHMVKEMDHLHMSLELRNKFEWGYQLDRLIRRTERIGRVDDGLDPGLLTINAHMTGDIKQSSSRSSLAYLFRALALQPDNIVINLSIAVAFVTSAMTTSEKRHYDIAQGQAFLYRYYELRTASGKACDLQEAEYNVGRLWHQLGLTHLAVPKYEMVLKLSEQVQQEYAEGNRREGEETEDFAKEAAFALQSIFMTSGNVNAARAIAEHWLVL